MSVSSIDSKNIAQTIQLAPKYTLREKRERRIFDIVYSRGKFYKNYFVRCGLE
jgi:hypothetical protein